MAKLLTTLEVAKRLGIETVSVRARVHRLRKRGKHLGQLSHSGRHGGAELMFSEKELALLSQNGLGGEQPNQWTAKKKKATKSPAKARASAAKSVTKKAKTPKASAKKASRKRA